MSAIIATHEDVDDFDMPMHPIAYLAKNSADTMYYDQAINQPDRDQFIQAIVKEFNDHIDHKHWQLIPRSEVPKEQKVLPSVWSMKRKRDIKTQEVYKWKARLNVHGGKQTHGVNYWETFAPVVTWITIRLLLVLTVLNNWKSRQIDFVLAYPQADIQVPMYMELPKGIEPKDDNVDKKGYVLQLLKNLYGQKQAGRVWSLFLKEKLEAIGFVVSEFDECLFYRDNVMFIVYVDDGIFVSTSDDAIDKAIQDLKDQKLNLEDQGDIKDYLGVNVTELDNGKIKLSQPHIIDQIIEDTKIPINGETKPTPAPSTKILVPDIEGKEFDNRFNYRSVIGKLNFLEKSTRPDIAYAVHQCARFTSNPRESHGKAVEYIAKYLASTRDEGIILDPDPNKSIETYADADFAGNWYKPDAEFDVNTARSRTGFILTYCACPITWTSKLQSTISLSSTEAEYVSLSHSMRETIPLMGTIAEITRKGFDVKCRLPRVHCKAFEDNLGAIELAKLPKIRPRTKHINVTYHHFREFVRKGLIKLFPIKTEDQIADLLTKPLPQNQFQKLRKRICGF